MSDPYAAAAGFNDSVYSDKPAKRDPYAAAAGFDDSIYQASRPRPASGIPANFGFVSGADVDAQPGATEYDRLRNYFAAGGAGHTNPAQAVPGAAPTAQPVSASFLGAVGQQIGNAAAGAVRGAGSIGATILSPIDWAARQLNGGQPVNVGGYDIVGQDRRAAMDQGLSSMGADPNSYAFQGGKLAGEVAGTAGIGSALGVGARALGMVPEVVSALSSSGMAIGEGTGSAVGNAALRATAGGITGALTASAIDPSSVGTGAAIGAVTPGAAWLLGTAGKKIASGVSGMMGSAAKSTLGATTGTGSSVIDAAYKAGVNGETSFLDNMRGKVSFSEIVDQAKDALTAMRQARGDEYRQGMAAVSGDKTVLDMTPIESAVSNAQANFGKFNGHVVNENANAAIDRVKAKVAEWSSLDPATFHTPEGLDKLKQWVGGELENAKPGTQTDAALKGIYNSIKSSIVAQAPTYAKTMSAYEAASEQLSEISRTLSLNPKASVDTSVRKLQSVLRNNVTTNFGNRMENVTALEQQGGANIVPAIAGQSMSSAWPRGIAGPVDAAMLLGGSLTHPGAAFGALAASPRLVGEAAYMAGRMGASLGSLGAAAQSPSLVSLPAQVAPVLGAQPGFSLADLLRVNQANGARPLNKP